MIRKYFRTIKTSEKDKIKWRTHEVTRVEALSDAIFGFAVSLLFISLEVPKSSKDLLDLMDGFAPFAFCFFSIVSIWYKQYIFFRRYGMHDQITIGLNTCLVFIVLFFAYPLKFLFSSIFLEHVYIMRQQDWAPLLATYNAGATAIFILFALMYLNAFIKRAELNLTPPEEFETVSYILFSALPGVFGLIATIIAYTERHNDMKHIFACYWPYAVLVVAAPLLRKWRASVFKERFGNIPMREPHHGADV